jgi:8-oxo-dGTP pyrophosphatase MutT (NUDIX family)
MRKNIATYHVGLKILLKKEKEFLFLTDSIGKHFDFPGGRIDEDELYTPLEKVVDREVKEEMGGDLKYRLGKPLFHFRRYFEKKNLQIFLVLFEAEYVSGDIKLSEEHSEIKWIDPNEYDFKEEEFFSKEEYQTFKTYFKT